MTAEHPVLVVGLGNPLSGDNGVGCALAHALAARADLPAHVEVIEGGSDLLRLESRLEDRRWILLVDALLDPDQPGRLLRFDGDLDELDHHGGSVHHMPPTAALRLLRCLYPALAAVPVTFLGVTIDGATVSTSLSPELDARLDDLADEILGLIAGR